MSLKANTSLFFAISRGILRGRHTRRLLLSGVVLVAFLMAFTGTVLIAGLLVANPTAFLIYWSICILLTFFSLLLALHDLLILAREARSERERLKAKLFDDQQEKQDKQE